MPRSSSIYACISAALLLGFAPVSALAGMSQDLASCTAAEGRDSAAACTRVMNSGRLPDAQDYIGYFNRGSSYERAGDFEKALADFDKVIKLRPSFARGYHARGLVQDDLGATVKALADLDRAIELDPKDWSAYVSRSTVRREKDDFNGALADLRKAAALDPKRDGVRLNRALILSDMGANAAARDEINDVIAQGHEGAAAYYARAAVAFGEQRLDDAKADLERALDERKSFAAAHTLMGRIAEARGDASAAKTHYESALAAPSNQIDGRSAKKTARARLSALASGKSANVALAQPAREVGCKRFLPATGTIISANCNE